MIFLVEVIDFWFNAYSDVGNSSIEEGRNAHVSLGIESCERLPDRQHIATRSKLHHGAAVKRSSCTVRKTYTHQAQYTPPNRDSTRRRCVRNSQKLATVSTSLNKFANSEVESRRVGGVYAPVGSRDPVYRVGQKSEPPNALHITSSNIGRF